MQALYYEAHINLLPEFDESSLWRLDRLCAPLGFRRAKLLMAKESNGLTFEESQKDMFLSARNDDFRLLYRDVNIMVSELHREGFRVLRAKVEAALMDTKFGVDPGDFFGVAVPSEPKT